MKKILLLDPSFAEVKLLNSTHRQEEKQGSTENHNQNVGNYGTNKETKKNTHTHTEQKNLERLDQEQLIISFCLFFKCVPFSLSIFEVEWFKKRFAIHCRNLTLTMPFVSFPIDVDWQTVVPC